MATQTKCITFYSYKGGSGRSTTAINTVRALAEKLGASPTRPILLVDADVESAGLTYYFNQKNKFCNDYTRLGTFHTTHILNVAAPANFPFGSERPESQKPIPPTVLKRFQGERCFPTIQLSNGQSIPGAELLEEVRLAIQDWTLLDEILEKYEVKRSKNTDTLLRHNPTLLVERLKRLHESHASPAEKSDCIREFLPARTFTDISRHFGSQCEAGTVRFLGVDVFYKGEQIAQSDTVNTQIGYLLEACKKRNYLAVIFDSGSGTQSTAHAFHQCSDVLVYCMRPSSQFISGTKSNIQGYQGILMNALEEKKSLDNGLRGDHAAKNIIILPTAVPRNTGLSILSRDSFKQIRLIAGMNKRLIDDSFCSAENALCEVELFKFREYILGVPPLPSSDIDDGIMDILKNYADPTSPDFPEDARSAYHTYNRLAEAILRNCEVCEETC